MTGITLERLNTADKNLIEIIAQWYFNEWNIPEETTVQKLSNYPAEGIPFQLILKSENVPIATGGLYNHIGLLDIKPEFNKFGPWLALIYTEKEKRNQGYGVLLCEKIEDMAKNFGLKKIYLYTHSAEKLYLKLNWKAFERFEYKERRIVVMEKKI